ncbi:26S proteasome non-ATPase regulatory subunit 6-like [Porphyridium purpureum]|uniref:26S proteasome non-ATPase regulatory subunit 6-like n=1 Tax=Porphyridium purpureum TaxID=35688 RepID=A0A5J4Z060_PORPP|nr:26S proteasome non-ATPase regulatory subunit 6-like [Porphyridium purpureum]|eukprot:POR7709..scf208_2
MADEFVPQDEILHLAALEFRARRTGATADADTLRALIVERNALPLYVKVAAELGWQEDEEMKARLQKQIDARLAELEEKLKDASENLGESEVRDALEKRAEFLTQILDKERAVAATEKAIKASVGSGQKLDLVFSMIRLALALKDFKMCHEQIEVAKEMIEKGGDWERRNRLKVYEATYNMSCRDMQGASKLFLEALATFSASEVYPFRDFVQYAVLTSMFCVDRPTLKQKVAAAPEVLSVLFEMPLLETFLNALVQCDYKAYMACLPEILELVHNDYFFGVHMNFIGRELRITAYAQFLASYQSVTMQAMSAAFGIGIDFLDEELSRFIVAGRLNCKIDRVGGVVHTVRPDARNGIYNSTIKHGDLLLNRIQKLSRVIDV